MKPDESPAFCIIKSMDDKLEKMNPKIYASPLSAGYSIEVLWEIVYELNQKVKHLEEEIRKINT